MVLDRALVHVLSGAVGQAKDHWISAWLSGRRHAIPACQTVGGNCEADNAAHVRAGGEVGEDKAGSATWRSEGDNLVSADAQIWIVGTDGHLQRLGKRRYPPARSDHPRP